MKLPSTGKVVNYRPFLVKEEKILLIATETGEQSDIIDAIATIIQDCTDLTDIHKLPTFDIEYVFLQIRTKSVGETVDVSVICPDDGETEVKVSIPLDEISVHKPRGHKKEIKLDDDVILNMGYPTLKAFVEFVQDFELRYAATYPDIPKVSLDAAVQRWRIINGFEFENVSDRPLTIWVFVEIQ